MTFSSGESALAFWLDRCCSGPAKQHAYASEFVRVDIAGDQQNVSYQPVTTNVEI